MSFSLVAAGLPDQVHRQLTSQLTRMQSWANNDTSQPEAVVDLIRFHLDKAAYANGLLVEANGHLDATQGSLTISVRPLYLPLEEQTQDTPADVNEEAA